MGFGFDYDYLYALQCFRESAPDALTSFFGTISSIAGGPGVFALFSIIYWCINKRHGSFLITANFASTFLGQLLKNILCVYRPWVADPRLHVADIAVAEATGYSCPSLHTIIATAFFGSLAYLRRDKKAHAIACIVMVLLVAFSRNFLGAHTLTDVVLGLALGIAMMFLAPRFINFCQNHLKYDWLIALAGVVLGVLFIIYATVKPYPLDYDTAGKLLVDPWAMQTDCYTMGGAFIGLALSWFVEHRWIRFNINASRRTRIIRGAVGVVTLLVLYMGVFGLFSLVLNAHWSHFVKYFLTVFYIVAGYPACFVAFEKWRGIASQNEPTPVA